MQTIDGPWRNFLSWVRGWYPEIQLGAALSLLASLLFPPFALDNSPGQTAFLGWHSLFTYQAGYVALGRLGCCWLLVATVATLAQLSAQKCEPSDSQRDTSFGRDTTGGFAPLGAAGTTALLALPLWFVLCGVAVGRSRILGLEESLGYFGCVALQLIVVSRLLLWLTRDRTNLQVSYMVLLIASLYWDLRTSPEPSGRVGGLVPIYLYLGYCLYLFDLRFVRPHRIEEHAVQPREFAQEIAPEEEESLPLLDAEEENSPRADVGATGSGSAERIDVEPFNAADASDGSDGSDGDPYDRYRPRR